MKCDICGSKKDVRKFYGFIHRKYYKECKQCFLQIMAKRNASKAEIDAEWDLGDT